MWERPKDGVNLKPVGSEVKIEVAVDERAQLRMMIPVCAPLVGYDIGYEQEAIVEAKGRSQGCIDNIVYEACPDSIDKSSVDLSEWLPWKEAGGGDG